ATRIKAEHNKSMDVRAKQRLCYRVIRQILADLAAVSPHLNSIVGRLPPEFLEDRKMMNNLNTYSLCINRTTGAQAFRL
ncbi:MAG: hypothetical protein M3521_07445, partial [Acidobacteriota bacterium]|nr:hypothetical protein [Acidobacteriota bacterium]